MGEGILAIPNQEKMMELKDIRGRLEEMSNEFDLLLTDETIQSFPKAYKEQIKKLDELIDEIEDAEENK
jgi:hypothetical protein